MKNVQNNQPNRPDSKPHVQQEQKNNYPGARAGNERNNLEADTDGEISRGHHQWRKGEQRPAR